jgi:hypothetical protein
MDAIKTKRTEITIDIEEVVIRRTPVFTPGWCERCGKGVQMLDANGASAGAGVTPRMIYRYLEAGAIHFTETPEGLTLICIDSLSRFVRDGDATC